MLSSVFDSSFGHIKTSFPTSPLMAEQFTFENVRIDNWHGRIPSQICTNKEIFNEIFSIDTWNKVLKPEQKERILQRLPVEVLETAGAAQQTIEDLLARTLNRFDSNPLESLFQQLDHGQFDPEVVETKVFIRKEWRKESLRKRKKYHAKLLEDIIVSQGKQLQVLKKGTKVNKNSYKPIEHHQQQNNDTDGLKKRIDKRFFEEMTAINKLAGCNSSSDDESPVARKQQKIVKKQLKKSLLSSISRSKARDRKTVPNTPSEPPPSSSKLTNALLNNVNNIAPPTPIPISGKSVQVRLREEQAAVKLAKLPKILPAPIQGNLHILPQQPPKIQSPLLSNAKALPLLTSQLSSGLKGKPGSATVKVEEFEFESSSDDEFEAIEPTIGVFLNPKAQKSKAPPPLLKSLPPNKKPNTGQKSTKPAPPLKEIPTKSSPQLKGNLMVTNVKIRPQTSTPNPPGKTAVNPQLKSKPKPATIVQNNAPLISHPVNIKTEPGTSVIPVQNGPPFHLTLKSSGMEKIEEMKVETFTSLGLNESSGDNELNLNLSLNLEGLDVEEEIPQRGQNIIIDEDVHEIHEMDKIDDLSVLDGNPFDSIPNLSDELDGFDLDLVDGLCDFEGLLSEEKQYASFFTLIRDVLCSTRDHRMTLVCMEKTIRKWSLSPTAALNLWFIRVNDWNDALITALNFLAGNYQDVHPEDFVPYIEYKYKTKYYQWIGAGRDSDNNLSHLCELWLDNMERLPPLKKLEGEPEDAEEEDEDNDDSDTAGEEAKKKSKRPQTPPPPRCVTDWAVRPSTNEEKESFQIQERARFENPHKAFTYRMHDYESVVGPVKGVYSSQSGMTNKARGHSLLVDDRPPYVTILALVRDAVARLPNGEGTRSEICEMLRDSAFLAAEASNVTLNSVVSGALDRLHYERDPCVRYDSHKKSWIYLHRDRTQEQFERLHHNRSYTKSTKSRNSSSRKSRKNSKSSTPAPTDTKIVSVTSATAGTGNVTKLPPVSSIIAKQVGSGDVKPILEVQLTQQTSVDNKGSLAEILSAPVQPALRFTLPSEASVIPTSLPQISTIQSSVGPSISTTLTSVSTSGQTNFAPGQFLFGSSLLRLASSLRLPEGVRFTQVRLPMQANAPGAIGGANNPLRMQQHRIILTRAPLPGQNQTQGVLLGQTSTGQTVILSTGGGNLGSLQATSAGQQATLAQLGLTTDSGQRPIMTVGGTPQSSTIQVPTVSKGGVMTTGSMATMVQSSPSQGTAQLTSPIIIRSNQGDFVIPGHISLGRGVQGIKVIPVPAGGNKPTMLARLIPSSPPVVATVPSQTNSIQQSQQP